MKNLRYVVVIIISIIIICELFLRLFFHEQLKTQKYPLIYRPDSIIGYTHIPNIKAYICRPSIDKIFQLNNHGFIGNDFSIVKEKDEIRIAVVGNSITEGIWYNSDENYVIKLQNFFLIKGYKKVKIINCSYGGIDKDFRNYLHITNYVSKFNPDIILFNVGIPFHNDNEVRENYKNYMIRYARDSKWSRDKAIEYVERLKEKKGFIFLYDLSYIFRSYCKRYSENNYGDFSNNISTYRENSSSAPDILTYQYSLQISIKLLSDLSISLKNNNITLIVWPFFLDQGIAKLLKENEIPFIVTDRKLNKSMIYRYDGHPNELGHEKIARLLYPKLLERLKELNFIKN
jgi:hypothetical protein